MTDNTLNISIVYKKIRDCTICNESITNADKIAILEMIKHEIVGNMVDAAINREEE